MIQLLCERQLRRRGYRKSYRFEDSSNPKSEPATAGLVIAQDGPQAPAGKGAGAAGEPTTPAPHQRSGDRVERLGDRRQLVHGDLQVTDIGPAGPLHPWQLADEGACLYRN